MKSNKTKDLMMAKKRTLIVFAALVVVVVVVSFFLYNSEQKHQKKVLKPVEIATPNTDVMKQKWLIKSQAQLMNQEQQIATLQSKIDSLSKENLHLQKEIHKKQKASTASPSVSAPKPNNTAYVNYPPPPPPQFKPQYNSHQAVNYPPPPNFNGKTKHSKKGTSSYEATQRPLDNLIAVAVPLKSNQTNQTKPNTTKPYNRILNQTLNQTNQTGTKRPEHLLIPPGSFVNAFLLTGADVPTMGGGSVGPIPVVFRVMSLTQMPNYFRANIKSCFLVGQAVGSLSAERAYVRVSKLSCIKKDGTPLVASVQGYAAGADGKAGLKGRVVSKQGAVLARSLISGFLQGVGEAFSQSQTTISVSPLGSTNSVAPDTHTLVKYGVGEGVGKATEMLAKFYMKMANQMFPVIEINAGRVADIIFLNGVKLGGAK